ncbi:DUF349 domain-containing protein [Antribacter sp. KLBMP9083]|uniref:DUF349 domain-containing protein n=1 Tax=Antribacter soli TaxID=2910976 RepID=A0AA41QGN5_9MICO|nr:DUF349 domain-containing protein [Antribacter soli]MCF4121857.1 DUF349 domain-containing protein [Antribacter soli]
MSESTDSSTNGPGPAANEPEDTAETPAQAGTVPEADATVPDAGDVAPQESVTEAEVAEAEVAEADATEVESAEVESAEVESAEVESAEVESDVEATVAKEVAPAAEAVAEADATAEIAAEAEVVEAVAEADAEEPVATEAPAAEAEVVEAAAEEPAAEAAPAARPVVPSPSALARPRAPKPSALRPAAPAAPAAAPAAVTQAAPAAAPVAPPVDAAAAAEAETFGRVDEDGTVYVREAAGERIVGQFPGVTPAEALALYVRRYLDLAAKVGLFETRLESADLSVKEIDQTLGKLGEETAEPAAVGDLDGLRARVEALSGRAAERRTALEEVRAAAKAEAVAARTEIVEAAEKIAATDPGKMQWRPAGEELRALLDRWKETQRSGPRIDRTTEESLWKRFSHARTAFDRERRHYFADLEQRNTAAKIEKEKLVAEAEALATSTDWGPTAGAYRDLMARWKSAGRASRKDDDALWARFRAAQDAFFQSRDDENAALDAEYGENLKVKEALLSEAEKLVPVKDLAAAKAALRDIQERWESAGKVPRGDVQRVEGRLRAVETAVRDTEQAQWNRSNPETRARAEGAAAQLQAAIEGLEADLAAAQAAGDKRLAGDLETALAARRSWLEQVVKAAEDSRG